MIVYLSDLNEMLLYIEGRGNKVIVLFLIQMVLEGVGVYFDLEQCFFWLQFGEFRKGSIERYVVYGRQLRVLY